MSERRDQIASTLRERITGMLRSGALRDGSRLPSVRKLAAQLDANPRSVLLAYAALTEEGLVERRSRSGMYVASRAPLATDGCSPLAPDWVAEIVAQGIERLVPASSLMSALHACLGERHPRALAIAATIDQVDGIARELRTDYGFEAAGLCTTDPGAATALPVARRADVLVTIAQLEAPVRRLAASLGKPCVVVRVRPELFVEARATLEREPVYVVVCDPVFADTIAELFAGTHALRNLHVLIAGRDNVESIPAGSSVYLTQSARARLGPNAARGGRLMPPIRLFSSATVRLLCSFLIDHNLSSLKGTETKAARRNSRARAGTAIATGV